MAEKITKKAVIATGGKQYLIAVGDEIEVELLSDEKTANFKPLLVIEGDNVKIGTPEVEGAQVTAEIIDKVKADKVVSIRYKAKKRVRKVRGHRQQLSRIKISKIS